jgi:hypothetical protein
MMRVSDIRERKVAGCRIRSSMTTRIIVVMVVHPADRVRGELQTRLCFKLRERIY